MTLAPYFGALAELPLFVVFQVRPKSGGRPGTDKVPVHPLTRQDINCHDERMRLTLARAEAYASTLPADYGVGYVLTDAIPTFFLDLDHALVDGQWAPYVQPVLDAFPGAYVETSRSGDGIHVLGLYAGPRPLHTTRCRDMRAELYTAGRFVALTGTHGRGAIGAADQSGGLAWLLQWFPPGEVVDADGWTTEPQPGAGIADDATLVDRACRSISARAAFGIALSFRQLWEGDADAIGRVLLPQTHGQPYDASAADLALANHLCFWSGGNCDQMERLMLASGLNREKYGREDYLRGTILKACAGQTQWYIDRAGTAAVGQGSTTPSTATVTVQTTQVEVGAPAPPGALQTVSGSASESAALAAPGGALTHTVTFDRQGRIESTLGNLTHVLREGNGGSIRYDLFTDNIILGAEPISDHAVINLRNRLEAMRVAPPGKETTRDAILAVARSNTYDSAQEWLGRQVWDGVPRIDTALHAFFGVDDTAYTRAVSAYMFTALAGRVIAPGCQADMVPVFVGPQGLRKSSAIAALSPSPEYFTELGFAEKEADLARKMRGKVVCEIAELQGLRSRDAQSIRAFITMRHDKWIPKFVEHSTVAARRALFTGTANEETFLDDDTGERRWLPMRCVRVCDSAGIEHYRSQLWAEGAARYYQNGIEWQSAERLAIAEHGEFKVADPWRNAIEAWLEGPPARELFTTAEVLFGALMIPSKDMSRREQDRAAKILKLLGYSQGSRVLANGTRAPRWSRTGA